MNLRKHVSMNGFPLSSRSVMVLDNGRISEYASPGELLTNKKSAFYSMAKDAGLAA